MERIVFGEIKKLFGNRRVVGFILCFMSLHILLFTAKAMDSSGNNFSFSSYRRLVSDIDTSRLSDEYESLKTEKDNIIFNGEQEPRYTYSRPSEYALYSLVLEEIEQILGYDDYLNFVLENNKGKSNISIFIKDKFSIRNEEKTRDDFQRVGYNQVTFSGTHGINLITKTDISDLIGLILITIFAVSLVTLENEESTMVLLRSTPYGRKRTAYSKYLLGLILSFITILLMYAYKLILIGLTYGFGDLHGSIQSVLGYSSCPFSLSIKEYLLLYIGLKLFVYKLMYSVFFFIGISFSQSRQVYVSIVLVLGISALFYYGIDQYHWLQYLKWLNPLAFLNAEYLITQYKNINILGYPFSYISVALITLTGLTICFGFLSIRGFCRNTLSEGRAILPIKQKLLDKLQGLIKVNRIFPKKIVLFFSELKKGWIFEKGIILFALVAVIVYITYEPMTERLYKLKDIYYKQYVKELEGEFTKEKLEYLYDELKEIHKAQDELSNSEGYSESALYFLRKKIEKEEGLLEAISYAEYLQETDGGSFVYSRGYDLLLGADDSNRDRLKLNILAVLLMIGLTIPIWGIEEWSGMKQILRISYDGRKWTFAFKYFNMIVTGLASFAVIYIPWIYKVYKAYGFGGLDYPVISIRRLATYPDSLTIAHLIIGFYFLHLVYLWIVGIGVRFINKGLKSHIITAIAGGAIFLAPILLLS